MCYKRVIPDEEDVVEIELEKSQIRKALVESITAQHLGRRPTYNLVRNNNRKEVNVDLEYYHSP